MRRSLSAALLLLAAPAYAQATEDPPRVQIVASAVDDAVVGEWTLVEVVDGGMMDELGAEIDAIELRIEADGDAMVHLEVTQDQETMTRQDAFHFTTANGEILAADRPAIQYEVIGDGDLLLTDSKGVVVHLTRVDSDIAIQ